MSVIQTGSVAILSFVFGDYISQLYSLGEFSPMIYAALAIVVLTIINIIGIRFGAGTQKLLTVLEIIGVLAIICAGFFSRPFQLPKQLLRPQPLRLQFLQSVWRWFSLC
jgi:amino acid transporter